MGVDVTLHRLDGQRVIGLPDPNGGVFDAAGDFDALIGSPGLPVIGELDPYGDAILRAQNMAGLIADIDKALEGQGPGPQLRGLRRFRVMATMVQEDDSLIIRILGD